MCNTSYKANRIRSDRITADDFPHHMIPAYLLTRAEYRYFQNTYYNHHYTADFSSSEYHLRDRVLRAVLSLV